MYRIGQEEIQAVKEVIETKDFFKVNNSCKAVWGFEEDMKKHFGANYASFTTSGTGALISALIALGIGPGDEVLVPAYTYIATAMAVLATGAVPVVTEVDATLSIDPADIERKITPNVKCIIPVHMNGRPCNMKAITEIAKKHNIFVLEDACQAVGSSYNGKFCGTIGDIGAFSFNFFKIISCGEGGGVITNDQKLYERSCIYHDASAIAFFGEQMKDFSEQGFCGTEYRGNELLAAVMRCQIQKLDGIIADLRRVKKEILSLLDGRLPLAPDNDADGDTGNLIAFRFETQEEAQAFNAKIGGMIPLECDRHVYVSWTPIMEKRGALHPLMDPFRMPANQGLRHNYTPDMCPQSLEHLGRTVYLFLHPDWDREEIAKQAQKLLSACN